MKSVGLRAWSYFMQCARLSVVTSPKRTVEERSRRFALNIAQAFGGRASPELTGLRRRERRKISGKGEGRKGEKMEGEMERKRKGEGRGTKGGRYSMLSDF